MQTTHHKHRLWCLQGHSPPARVQGEHAVISSLQSGISEIGTLSLEECRTRLLLSVEDVVVGHHGDDSVRVRPALVVVAVQDLVESGLLNVDVHQHFILITIVSVMMMTTLMNVMMIMIFRTTLQKL